MKDNQNNSFRRKDRTVIADSKNDRDQRNAQGMQNQMLGNIHDRLGDVQSAAELGNETTESKSNEILESLRELNKTVGDSVAAGELSAESSESSIAETRKLNDTASQISEKLSQLTNMLENKFQPTAGNGAIDGHWTSFVSEALAIIADNVPDIKENTDGLKEAIEKIKPAEPSGSSEDDILPPSPPPTPDPVPPSPNNENSNSSSDSSKKNKDKNSLSSKMDELIAATKGGFKQSIGFADKISGMLFKYTVTAAIEAAKTAAMILAIVVALDVIKIHFNYWSKLFETNFTAFNEKAKEWGPLLESIINTVKDVKDAWDNNDWGGLALAIVKGMGKVIGQLGELIILGISKAVAGLLRAFGKDDTALDIEGDALQTFQEHTGAKLSDENATTLAKYQAKQYKSQQESLERRGTGEGTRSNGLYYGTVTKDELNKMDSGQSTPIANLSQDDQIAALKANNEANGAVTRFNNYLEDANPNSRSSKANIQKAYDEVVTDIKNPALDKAPELKAMLQKSLDDITAKYENFKSGAPKVQPESSKENGDVQSVKRIEQSKAQPSATSSTDGSPNYVQVNNLNKSNTTMYQMPPQSSSPAPGIYGAAAQVN